MNVFPKNTPLFDKQLYRFSLAFIALLMIEPVTLIALYETPRIVEPVIRYFILCFIAGFGLIYFILRFLPRIFLPIIAFTLIFGLYSLKLSFYTAFTTLPDVVNGVLFLMLIGLTASILSKFKKKNIRISNISYLVLLVIMLASPIQLILGSGTANSRPFQSDVIPQFQETPNIYLLSYDSLVPEDPIIKKLGIDQLPYKDIFEKDFYRLNAGMSFHVPSRPSINNVMRLSQKKYDLDVKTFSGNSSSYLQRIMKQNGYHIVNGYRGLYFGTAGPFVDQSLIPDYGVIEYSVLCIASEGIEKMQAYGLCSFAKFLKKNQLEQLYKLVLSHDKNHERPDFHQQQMRIFKENITKDKPVFTYTYTYNPIGHTSGNYDHDNLNERREYKGRFISHGKRLETQLSEVMDFIKSEDPNALLIVFGDHGAYLSRQVNPQDDPEFYYKDRNGILIAVAKTNHPCSQRFASYRNDTYNTPSRVMLEIFSCLSGDQFKVSDDAFDEDQEIAKYILK